MQWMDALGYLGALLTLATFSMKTMLRLRAVGIISNFAFISYGALGHVYPVLLLHLALLPLNIWRLHQLLRLTRQINEATAGASSRLSLDWLKPFSRRKVVLAGQMLFRQGDAATELLVVLKGRFRALEADVAIGKGEVMGELGLVSQAQVRTQTIVCEEDATLLLLSYDEVRQMYFQNPKFGFFLLQLVAERLTRDAQGGPQGLSSQAALPLTSPP